MSSLISVRLTDKLVHETKSKARTLHLSQTEYIRKALERMNDEIDNQAREQRLKHASLTVRAQSMKINAEFSDIDNDPDA